MGNRHPLTQAGRTQALAREQAVEYRGTRDALVMLEQHPRFVEDTALAGELEIERDIGFRQQPGDDLRRGLDGGIHAPCLGNNPRV